MALSFPNSPPKLTARFTEPDSGKRRNRRTSVTALDIQDGWLHVVQAVTRGGQTRIVSHSAVAVTLKEGAPLEDAAALGEAVRRALTQLPVKPGPVVMGVPRAQVMLRRLELPPAQKQAEVASMVYLQVSRDLPFRLDEASLDFKVLPASHAAMPAATAPEVAAAAGETVVPPTAPTKVLAAVVRRETVQHYQTLADTAGLKLVALGLRSVAGARAVEFCHREPTDGCVALVSIRAGEVIFDVMLDHAMVFSRVGTLPAGAEGGEGAGNLQAAATKEAVVLEVVRSLHSYESADGHQRVARFFVAGATGIEAEIADALHKRFEVTAQVLDPSAALAEAEGDGTRSASALPAIGLALEALDPAGLSFDFLNPKRPPVPRDFRRVRTLGAVAGCLALVMMVVGLRTYWIRQREAQRASVREQIALATKNLSAFRLVRSQALALKAWQAGNRDWLDHLALLSALLPHSRDLYVTVLSTSPRNTITLAVRVRSSEILDRASSALRAAGYQVRPPAITPVSDRYGYHLQASLELTVPAKVTNDLDHLTVESRPSAPPVQSSPPSAAPAPPAPAPAVPAAAPAPASRKAPPARIEANPRRFRREPGASFDPNRRRRGRRVQEGGAGE